MAMNIEESLIRLLQNDSVLSNYTSNRVYFIYAPENANYPLIILQKISAIREHAFIHDPNLSHSRFQITAYTTDYPVLKIISEQINSTGVLKDFTGRLYDETSGAQVDYTEYLNEVEINIDPILGLYGVALDWMVSSHEN
jgi:hypothetical protein